MSIKQKSREIIETYIQLEIMRVEVFREKVKPTK